MKEIKKILFKESRIRNTNEDPERLQKERKFAS